MKAATKVIVALLLFFSLMPLSTFAAVTTPDTQIVTYYEDGSYMTVELISVDSRSTSTKTGTKVYTCYGNDQAVQWKATLSATFEYTGTTATCTAAVCTVSITNRDWYIISKSATKSGNIGYGYLTMGRSILNAPTEQKSVTLKITCSPSGVLS